MHRVAFTARVFKHHDGIRAGWNGGASHDLHASSRLQWSGDGIPCFDFADAWQFRAWDRFCSAQGETVTRGAIEGRVRTIRFHVLGEHIAERVPNADCGSGARTYSFLCLFDDRAARLFVG